MKWVVVLGIAIIVLSSGCTVQEAPVPGGNETNGSLSEARAVPSGPGWFCGSFRLNGTLADNRTSMVIDALRQAGFSFIGMIIDSDHPEYIETCNEITSSGILCIPCQEAGNSEGRFVAVGIHGEIGTGQDLGEMIDQAHELGGVVYLTHPMSTGNRTPWKRWDIPSWDAIAVVSPMTQKRQDDEKAMDKWHSFLDNGHVKYAMGETTIRSFTTTYNLRNMLDSSYQCLWIEGKLTEESLKDALLSGNSYVTNGPVIDFTINGSGMGDTVQVDYGEQSELHIDITSDMAFDTVRVIRDGEVMHEIGRPAITYNTTLNVTVVGESWFTVEVWGGDTTPEYHDFVHAMSNPIWINSTLG